MNKQILIDTAKRVIKIRQLAKDEYCKLFFCDECPCSWENNEDKISCFLSGRYKLEWLQNWLKENETTEVNNTDVVISRELLDELIGLIDMRIVGIDRYKELVKLRGEK